MNIKFKSFLCAGILLYAIPAAAQLSSAKCSIFAENQFYYTASSHVFVSTKGYGVIWNCVPKQPTDKTVHTYVILTLASFQTLTSLGGKLTTAKSSEASFNSSLKRHVRLGYLDPSLAELRKDFEQEILARAPEFVSPLMKINANFGQ